jgi:hypothetical protein
VAAALKMREAHHRDEASDVETGSGRIEPGVSTYVSGVKRVGEPISVLIDQPSPR